MASQEYALTHPMNPIEEMMPPEEFTDRDEILRYLEEWFRNIKDRRSRSKALISPRRMGKTSVLDRFVNVMFWREHGVVPFYVKVKREETALRQFARDYFSTLCRQFLAYIIQDPLLYRNEISLDALLELTYARTDPRIKALREYVKWFLDYDPHVDPRSLWEAVIRKPEALASETGIHVAVIIDEFQEMKFHIYDAEDTKDIIPGKHMPTDLTATYDRMSQSTHAPMLVSGSAVTLVFRTVMGGPLGGRFSVKKLGPMAIADGAELARRILSGKGIPIPDEMALYLSELVGGHPYYIYCLANTEYPGATFATPEDIEAALDWELRYGVIHGFWQSHFANYAQTINADTDPKAGKRIIYYLLKYQDRPVDVQEIAGNLNVPEEIVLDKLQKLCEADLIEQIGIERYQGLQDRMLARYIYQEYGRFVEEVDRIRTKPPGVEGIHKGRYLELQVENLLHRFHGQRVPGEWFGLERDFTLPEIIQAYDTAVKSEGSREYQVDAIAIYRTDKGIAGWVAECKNKKRPMSRAEVEKAESAAEAVKTEQRWVDVSLWLVSAGGFTDDAIDLIRQRGHLYSTRQEVDALIQFFGGHVLTPEPEDDSGPVS